MHRWPLREGWQEADLIDEETALMCEIATIMDNGKLDGAGFEFSADTWKPGLGSSCNMRIRTKHPYTDETRKERLTMKIRFRFLNFATAFLFVIVMGTILLFPSAAQCDVVIAIAAPMTGSGAQYGELFKTGAEAGAADINEKGGVLGHKILIRAYDDKNNPTEAANVAQKISIEKNVVGVIGHFASSATYAAMPTYQKNGVPVVVISSTDPALTKQGYTFLFRICITQETDGSASAKWLVNKLGKKRIAAIYMNTDYGKAHFAALSKALLALGGEVAVEERYQPGTVDFSPALIKIKNANVDAIELGTYYNDSALIVKQTRKLGMTMPIVASGGALAPALIELGGEAVEGMYVSQMTTGPRMEEAAAIYKKVNKVDKVPAPQFSLVAFDAVQFVAEAIKRGNSIDRNTIQKTLSTIKDFPTTTGYSTFDEERQVRFTYMDVVQVKNGQFVIVGSSR